MAADDVKERAGLALLSASFPFPSEFGVSNGKEVCSFPFRKEEKEMRRESSTSLCKTIRRRTKRKMPNAAIRFIPQ